MTVLDGQLARYADPVGESALFFAVSGQEPVLISPAAEITSDPKHCFDKQRAKGRNFGRQKFLGSEPLEFDVEFQVWPEDEANFKSQVLPFLRSKKKSGDAPPIDVINPNITMWGITTVTVLSATVGHPSVVDGRSVRLKLREWTPAPVAPKKTKTAKDRQGLEKSANELLAQPPHNRDISNDHASNQ